MRFSLPWVRRTPPPIWAQAYEAGPWPAPNLPWREVPYVVLDTETSGLDARRDVLLSVGLVEVRQGRVCLDSRWRSLIRPPAGFEVGGGSIRIHGLMRAELAVAPTLDEVLPAILERLTGRALVVHVAQVDVGFLNQALRPHHARLRGPILDTARLAHSLHENAKLLGEVQPDMPRPAIQLRALAQARGLPVYGEHDALNDALTTAQLFLAQATRLEQQGIRTLRKLLRAGGV
ncbi:MAG: PolC-type DNA polymerase III [Oscillochloridaceae bacterium umkhey_bin13]